MEAFLVLLAFVLVVVVPYVWAGERKPLRLTGDELEDLHRRLDREADR